MKTAFAAVLLVSSVIASAAEPAPLMKILIKPGAMSEAAGKGVVEVTMTIPAMEAAAGVPLLTMSTMVPGASRPQPVEDLTLSDATGPVPLESQPGGVRKWSPTRAVKVTYCCNTGCRSKTRPALREGRKCSCISTATASPAPDVCY